MYELAAFLIIVPLSYALSRVVKLIQRNSYEDDVRTLFYLYWNGKAEDELYAWYKVRQILTERNGQNTKLQFVDRKISEINKQELYGNMSVTESGHLLDEASDKKIR